MRHTAILLTLFAVFLVSATCPGITQITPPPPSNATYTPYLFGTIEAGIAGTQTASAPTPDIPATIAAGVAGTQAALGIPSATPTGIKILAGASPTPTPTLVGITTPTPDMSTLNGNPNVAEGLPVIERAGGVNYEYWGHANDQNDYNTTTQPGGGRWGIQTNTGNGSYQVVDLVNEYIITGVGYSLDWDGAFKNPLRFVVQVSGDMENWQTVSDIVHPYDGINGSNWVNINVPVEPVVARFVKFWEPPDGMWNGWGDFFEVRVFGRR